MACLVALALAVAGCERTVRNMYDQPKLKEASTSPLFADGLAGRPPPPGSVPAALGIAATDASGRTAASPTSASRSTSGPAVLARGAGRHAIYCAPCHGPSGDGDGVVVQRGFPPPPSYDAPAVREADDAALAQAVADGRGVMPGFADRLDDGDRRAVVAWVRHLQARSPARAPRR